MDLSSASKVFFFYTLSRRLGLLHPSHIKKSCNSNFRPFALCYSFIGIRIIYLLKQPLVVQLALHYQVKKKLLKQILPLQLEAHIYTALFNFPS